MKVSEGTPLPVPEQPTHSSRPAHFAGVSYEWLETAAQNEAKTALDITSATTKIALPFGIVDFAIADECPRAPRAGDESNIRQETTPREEFNEVTTYLKDGGTTTDVTSHLTY